jgi:maleamate amidohydrolase
MKEPALIVIDMVNDFLRSWAPAARQRLIRSTNSLLEIVRRQARPVIWVRQEFRPDLQDAFLDMREKGVPVTIQGTPGCEIVPELEVARGDAVIVKKRYSAFFGTNLDQVLADLRPDGLILAGVNTHACIRTTAIDAYQRDWKVVLAAECVGSYDQEHHEVSLRYMERKFASVLSNEQIRRMLASRA